jgi:hypothetical protein
VSLCAVLVGLLATPGWLTVGAGVFRAAPWPTGGRYVVDTGGRALHQLPCPTEGNGEAADHHEGEIGHEVQVVWMENKRNG